MFNVTAEEKQFKKGLNRTIILPFFIFFTLGAIQIFRIGILKNTFITLDNTDIKLIKAHKVDQLLTELEADVHGYVLLRSQSFTQTYEATKKEFNSVLAELQDLVKTNPSQTAMFNNVRLSVENWDRQSLSYLKYRDGGTIHPATRSFFINTRDLIRGLHIELTGFVAEENRVRADRVAFADKAYFMTYMFWVMAVLFGCIILYVWIRYNFKVLWRRFYDVLLRANTHTESLTRSNVLLERYAHLASHDLKEPVRTIGCYTDLLRRQLAALVNSDPSLTDTFNFIKNATDRMTKLITAILDYAISQNNMQWEMVDLNEVIKDVESNLAVSIRESNTVITSDKLPSLPGDRTRLNQLFQNLVSNAIKFRKLDLKESNKIYIKVSEHKDTWEFSVTDTGIGVDYHDTTALFNPFTRLDNSRPGNGLGLAVCKQVIDLHGGDIHLESKGKNQGSTFIFTLPKNQYNRHHQCNTLLDSRVHGNDNMDTKSQKSHGVG